MHEGYKAPSVAHSKRVEKMEKAARDRKGFW